QCGVQDRSAHAPEGPRSRSGMEGNRIGSESARLQIADTSAGLRRCRRCQDRKCETRFSPAWDRTGSGSPDVPSWVASLSLAIVQNAPKMRQFGRSQISLFERESAVKNLLSTNFPALERCKANSGVRLSSFPPC